MKERPILMSTPMVQAIMEGRKTMTRRVVKEPLQSWMATANNPEWFENITAQCPYGKPGDRLWVKETYQKIEGGRFIYKANPIIWGGKWKPSIFMPRAASRITLEITNIRVERLQDITEEDAKNEGLELIITPSFYRNYLSNDGATFYSAIMSFSTLWESINGKGSWDANPWVWVIEFEKLNG